MGSAIGWSGNGAGGWGTWMARQERTRGRLAQFALALAIIVLGIGGVVAVTEYGAGADAAAPLMLAHDDIERALRGRGLDVSPTERVVTHARLGVTGRIVLVDGVEIEVYLFPSVAERVAAEPSLASLRAMLSNDTGAPELRRVTSARNALLHYSADSALALRILGAARDLSLATSTS